MCPPISRPPPLKLYSYCYTYGFIYAGATQGELPEGQEKVPWGDTRAAQLVGLVATDGTYEFHLSVNSYLLSRLR